MKILHIALKSVYTEGFSYQENFLTKYHSRLGNEVFLVTNLYTRKKNQVVKISSSFTFSKENGVLILRLKEKRDRFFQSLMATYPNLKSKLNEISPDLIFLHGFQLRDILIIKRFVMNKNIKLIIDNHADYSNSANTFFSKYVLHKIIWRLIAKYISPQTTIFYGVNPNRVDFLKQVYGLKSSKVELLRQGADDDLLKNKDTSYLSKRIRFRDDVNIENYIVTGGKLESLSAQLNHFFNILNDSKRDFKMLVFGSISNETETMIKSKYSEKIKYIGWLNVEEIYNLIKIAKGFVFLGRHSVIWEQVIAHDIPIMINSNNKFEYLNTKGKVFFYDKLDITTINRYFDFIKKSSRNLNSVNSDFLYSNIARESLKRIKL